MLMLCIIAAIIAAVLSAALGRNGTYYQKDGSYRKITTASSFRYCMEHPALQGIGQFVLPWENGVVAKIVPPLSLGYMCMCLGYHGKTVADGINFLVEMSQQKKLHAYDFYTPEEAAVNRQLATTKLLYISGKEGMPFAVVIAGGGFNSVCMMQEAFPVAKQLHAQGYPVFMLKYRVGRLPEDQTGTDKRNRGFADLQRAMIYIFDHAAKWGVRTQGYSVWGFSAGARMTLAWSANEKYGFRTSGLPKPGMQVPIYTVPENIPAGADVPATFMAMGTKDEFYGEEGCRACSQFCKELKEAGIPAVFHAYKGVRHGFGLGVGTPAENWLRQALKLWEEVVL